MLTEIELTNRLNTAYFLLHQTAEHDIRSAHDVEVPGRPVLPGYLDSVYPHLLRAAELERDVEDDLDETTDFGGSD